MNSRSLKGVNNGTRIFVCVCVCVSLSLYSMSEYAAVFDRVCDRVCDCVCDSVIVCV